MPFLFNLQIHVLRKDIFYLVINDLTDFNVANIILIANSKMLTMFVF